MSRIKYDENKTHHLVSMFLAGRCPAKDGVGLWPRAEGTARGLWPDRGAGRGQRALCVELTHARVVLQSRLQVTDVVDHVLDHL